MENNFEEVLNKLKLEEWRRWKKTEKYEVLTNPHDGIWLYVNQNGELSADQKTKNQQPRDVDSDSYLRSLDKLQNQLYVAIKRRAKEVKGTRAYLDFENRVAFLNKEIENKNKEISERFFE